jgi:hypothetical protein
MGRLSIEALTNTRNDARSTLPERVLLDDRVLG